MDIQSRTQLPDLIRHLGLPMIAAELGVAEGNNSRDLLAAGMEKLYMVDRWQYTPIAGDSGEPQEWHDNNYQQVLDKVSEYGDKAIILKGDSVSMSYRVEDSSLSMVYIDADHSYEGVKKDLVVWGNKVVSGGIIAGHDYLNKSYGVYKAVQEYCILMGYTPITIPESNPDNASFYIIKS